MRMICAICGRPTMPFVMIGREAVGPKCARKVGLVPSKALKGSRLRFSKARPPAAPIPQNLDLFENLKP